MSLLTQALVGVLIAAPAAFAESQTLTLVISPEALESNPTLEEMKRETARLVSPAEYSFAWLPKGQAALGDSFEQLVVVRFRGACRSRAENEPASMEAGSLAATAVSGGQVLPFVEVDCDRTRRLISPAIAGLPGGARDVLFGRALGRVLAHELYHVLAQTTDHKEQGVSKPCSRLADLVSTRFRFDPVSLGRMRPATALAAAPRVELDAVADDAGAGR